MNKNFIQSAILIIFFNLACNVRTSSEQDNKDFNIYTQNMAQYQTNQNWHFLGMERIKDIKLGMIEEEVFKVLGSDKFKTRYSFNQVLGKRLRKLKYIPITKSVSFAGTKTIVIQGDNNIHYKPIERLGVAFFFYHNRLIHITINHDEKRGAWNHLPDSSEEILYILNNKTDDEPLSYTETNAAGDAKFYGFTNGYLGEKFNSLGQRNFFPIVPRGKHMILDSLGELCKKFTYWEFPDYESDLQKSGYYKLKSQLDKDFENKTGYWKEKI